MEKTKGSKIKERIQLAAIILLCVAMLLLEFLKIPYSKEEFRNEMLSGIVQKGCGSLAALLLMFRFKIRLFGRVEHALYLLPCLAIAVNNFQWWAYLSGKMQLVHTQPLDFVLFTANCCLTGLFEELIFRGIIFSLLLDYLEKDKKGFYIAYILSCGVFAIMHLFNGISFGTVLQVGYTFLTGGLFAFCLIKTKNIFCCAAVHAVYNFCGMLFDVRGLGAGVVFDIGTVITMAIVDVLLGIFVLYKLWTYSQAEREELYGKMGVKRKDFTENHEENGN